ncbi:polo-like kinase 1 [Nematocida displodere]|uniref:Polo-like kinase 1 n=1 Tax=Nematocida displodere TaxID=1805483 RepID=A0A177EBQ0_9MICR|nr:polo-like kinase 1 [Nematocida displodere]
MKNPPFLPIGTVVHNRDTSESFQLTGLIGQGGFAQCFSVLKTATNEEFAAKIIKKSELVRPKNKQKLLSEIKIHLSVNHKNIVKLFTYFEDKNFVFLIMEICHNKSMMDFLKRSKKIEERYVRVFLLQIVSALEYLHKECSVIHRDMKLANLFLDKSFNIKVGDFGLAAVIDREERKKTICGTPNYIAPEVLFNSESGHSFEVDIWSVGVIVYTMIIGKPPFQKSDVKEIYRSIKTNDYVYPADSIISDNARELINGLLELSPEKRLTLEEIYNSPFVREISTDDATPRAFQTPYVSAAYASGAYAPGVYAQTAPQAASLPKPGNTPSLFSGAASQAAKYAEPQARAQTKVGLLSSVHAHVMSLLSRNLPTVGIDTECAYDYAMHTVDCTNKYGLGYVLVSGTVGILFNDCTSIVIRRASVEEILAGNDKYYFEYFEHKVYGVQKIITKEKHHTSSIGSKLEKKVLLIKYFINALFSKQHTFVSLGEENVFVIKHVTFGKGPVLRLSNRTIVFIIDTKVLVFSNEGKVLFAEGRQKIEREVLVYCHEVLSILLKK